MAALMWLMIIIVDFTKVKAQQQPEKIYYYNI